MSQHCCRNASQFWAFVAGRRRSDSHCSGHLTSNSPCKTAPWAEMTKAQAAPASACRSFGDAVRPVKVLRRSIRTNSGHLAHSCTIRGAGCRFPGRPDSAWFRFRQLAAGSRKGEPSCPGWGQNRRRSAGGFGTFRPVPRPNRTPDPDLPAGHRIVRTASSGLLEGRFAA